MLDDFLTRAALAGAGLTLATGPLGSFVVWRRMAYFGDATAHAAILGVALSFGFGISVYAGTLAVALSRGFLGAEQLASAKKGACILNFARGELVDTAAVLEALDKGIIGKYITDFPTDELIAHKDVIAIPHLGASTPESEDNCSAMAAEQLKEYIEHGNIQNSVNLPSCCMPHSTGIRLTFVHKNATNMVGQITSILAGSQANIDNMINKSKGNMAYTMIDFNNPISAETIAQLNAIDGVIRVRQIRHN